MKKYIIAVIIGIITSVYTVRAQEQEDSISNEKVVTRILEQDKLIPLKEVDLYFEYGHKRTFAIENIAQARTKAYGRIISFSTWSKKQAEQEAESSEGVGKFFLGFIVFCFVVRVLSGIFPPKPMPFGKRAF